MSYAEYTRQEILEDLVVYEKRNQKLLKEMKAINDILDEELNAYRSGRENWTILYRRITEIIQNSEFKEDSEK